MHQTKDKAAFLQATVRRDESSVTQIARRPRRDGTSGFAVYSLKQHMDLSCFVHIPQRHIFKTDPVVRIVFHRPDIDLTALDPSVQINSQTDRPPVLASIGVPEENLDTKGQSRPLSIERLHHVRIDTLTKANISN